MAKARTYLDLPVAVTLEKPDGTEETFEITFELRDTLRYEAMEGTSPMAGFQENGMPTQLAMAKLAWLHLRRKKLVLHQRFKDFEEHLVDMWMLNEDDDEDETADGDESEDGGGVQLPDPTESAPTAD